MSTQQRQHPRPAQQQARPQMAQRPARRLPTARRLDYILIPAPLDLSLSSLSTLSEKSPLPSIIVTPSSPTHFGRGAGDAFSFEGAGTGEDGGRGREYDYAIAFMVQPTAPGFVQRTVAKAKAVVGETAGRVSERMRGVSPMGWTWRNRGYAPIALPISAPPTQTEFNVPTFPPEKKRTNKVLVVLTAVFVLVFCHMLAHFFTRASLYSPIPLSSASLDLASTSPVLPNSNGYMVPATIPGSVEGGVKAKAYALLGKMEVKGWLGWAVGGKRGDV